MNILLKFKHWILLTIMMIPSIITDIADLNGFWYWGGALWTSVVYTCWLFSIGNTVYNREGTSRFMVGLFKVGAGYLIIYLLLFGYEATKTSENFPTWQISLHFVAILISFYLIFFVAKNLVNYEKHQHLETKSVFITFCALGFFPVGIFFIQPRVNHIASGDISN